jgi:hypothetical protein
MQGIHALPPIPPSPAQALLIALPTAMDIVFFEQDRIAFGCGPAVFLLCCGAIISERLQERNFRFNIGPVKKINS